MSADHEPPKTTPPPTDEPPPWTVLCVDDEPSILSALRRVLRPLGCRVVLAEGAQQALALLASEAVDVVISDMRMPGMDGAELLRRVAAEWPATPRLLLTGFADTNAAIAAINHGQIFRYISKPWDDEELRLTVRQAADHRRLQAERDHLQALTVQQNEALQSLNAELEQRVAQRTTELSAANERLKRNYLSSIRVFSHLLGMRSPALAGHGKRVADLARRVTQRQAWPEDEARDVFIAGLLHDIGYVAIPESIMNKSVGRLTAQEMAVYQRHPVLGAQAMLGLEDAQGVAAIVRSHHERYDGSGFPDALAGAQIPRGAQLLSLASTYDDLLHGHIGGGELKPDQARAVLEHGRGSQFEPELLDTFLELLQSETPAAPTVVQVAAKALQPGMRLGKDLLSREGVLLLSAGHVLDEALIRRIRQVAHKDGVEMSLAVQVPSAEGKRADGAGH